MSDSADQSREYNHPGESRFFGGMSMSRGRSIPVWSVALVCALVLVFSSAPTQVLRALSGAASGPAFQDPVPPPTTQDPADPAAGRGAGRGQAAPQPYSQLMGRITGLKSDDGIFKVDRGVYNGTDSVFFEIPNTQLDKDFVWNVSIKKTTIGAGLAGQEVSNRVVRWSKRGDRLLLQSIDYSITGEDDPDVSKAVADANYPAIIATLPIAAYTDAKDASVVDLTNFFMDGVAEFRAGVVRAIDYAQALGVGQLNCLAGKAPAGIDEATLRRTFVENLRHAAAALKKEGLKLLIEPINTFDIPGFYLNRTAQAAALLDEVDADNAFIQYDIYHAQRMEGELAATFDRYQARIAHVQLADNPGRHEPGTGEINYDFLFAHLDARGYAGWIGCEYKPATTTAAGLGWMTRRKDA